MFTCLFSATRWQCGIIITSENYSKLITCRCESSACSMNTGLSKFSIIDPWEAASLFLKLPRDRRRTCTVMFSSASGEGQVAWGYLKITLEESCFLVVHRVTDLPELAWQDCVTYNETEAVSGRMLGVAGLFKQVENLCGLPLMGGIVWASQITGRIQWENKAINSF